jgi:glycosyltransferase involved in cell wall biosynthesis
VAGTGAELPLWRQRAVDAGIASRIEFLGFREDVPDLMRAIDLHVSPTRYEPYSLVTQEALCCGAPAFVSRIAGIAERYPPELQELLIPDPNDARDLANRLRRWRSRHEELAPPVAQFSERLRAYTWNDMARQFVDAMDRESS